MGYSEPACRYIVLFWSLTVQGLSRRLFTVEVALSVVDVCLSAADDDVREAEPPLLESTMRRLTTT